MASFEEEGPRAKRRRVGDNSFASTPISITSHKQLRDLLVFRQNISQETKQGVRHFKDFLSSIHANDGEGEKGNKLKTLKAYCDSQIVKGGEGSQSACFTDLIQTWTFAETNNDESLLSLIPSVLALFLKTISSELEFRDFALELCKYLLQKEQLNLLNRGLTATKAKDHLISPCLRLLTEIVSFDGGEIARVVYAKREVTFKRLDIFLAPRKVNTEEESGDRRQPTLRRIAQRYLLANFKFQDTAAKSELIGQGKLIRVFIEDIRRDAQDIVLDIIKVIDKHIAGDSALPRSSKSRFLNRHNLERLVTLYGFEKDLDEAEATDNSVSDQVHKFLLETCTNFEKGVLLRDSGWYPQGHSADSLPNESGEDGTIPLGLDSPVNFDKFKESAPVRNGNLSALIQCLRPESDTRQMELLLKVFKVAPELVYDYFSKRTMFVSDPKPNQTWLGESAFLFSTIQLPVPVNCGWRDGLPIIPPPVSVVIESIIPRPLTQRTLIRCMNMNADVITLFAVKTAAMSLKKLEKVLIMFRSVRGPGQKLWNQAASRLIGEFCRRCPTMKDAIVAFRQTAKDDLQQQEAILELIATFYQAIPTVAFEEKFDASLTLVEVLSRLDDSTLSDEDRSILFNQLQHLLVIAQHSPTMRWWQKPESLPLSAFTSVLKTFAETKDNRPQEKINTLLQDVLIQSSVLANPSSFTAFIKSLHIEDGSEHAVPWSFIDNCVVRLVKKPVLYLDQANSLLEQRPNSLSLLAVVVDEQWPFAVKAGDDKVEMEIAAWASKFIGYLKSVGEDKTALTTVRDSMTKATHTKKAQSLLKKAFKQTLEDANKEPAAAATKNTSSNHVASKIPNVQLEEIFGVLPTEDESHSALHKWEREDLEIALDQGHIGDLIRYVCSEHEEIRRQAVASLSRFMAKLKESTYTEKESVYVLIGELLETVREVGLETPAPYIVGELAARMLVVLIDPLHSFYGKVNQYLHKGPRWEVAKIPSYWIDKILFQEPERDDHHHEEVGWLLDLFVNGLRSERDMDVYRRAGVFERIFSLYSSPSLPEPLRRKILHLVFRVCQIGGSTTLITRSAAISWIEGQVSALDTQSDTLRALATELSSTCNHDWVDRWSGSAFCQTVTHITSLKVDDAACA